MYSVHPVDGLPEFRAGDELPTIIAVRLAQREPKLCPGDILVVTQKIVSKCEDRFVSLAAIKPSPRAVEVAAATGKDPALVEAVLRESTVIVRQAPNVLITRHRLGHVMANAGIDASNIGPNGSDRVLLLPENPDASARRIADACKARIGILPPVVISDSFGRPWRVGTVNVAVGLWGLPAICDQRGEKDRDGRVMQVTQIAFADSVASAAGLAMGEGREGLPVCIVRGLKWQGEAQTSRAILRPEREDLFL